MQGVTALPCPASPWPRRGAPQIVRSEGFLVERQLSAVSPEAVIEPERHAQKTESDLELAGDAIESDRPEGAPFLNTIPWLAPPQAPV